MSPRRLALALFAVGAALGGAIWMFSPWLAGSKEPWDADVPVWQLSWIAVAIGGSLAGRALGVLLPLGYAVGQMLATLGVVLKSGFGILGWLFIVSYGVAAMLGTLLLVAGAALARRFRRPGRTA